MKYFCICLSFLLIIGCQKEKDNNYFCTQIGKQINKQFPFQTKILHSEYYQTTQKSEFPFLGNDSIVEGCSFWIKSNDDKVIGIHLQLFDNWGAHIRTFYKKFSLREGIHTYYWDIYDEYIAKQTKKIKSFNDKSYLKMVNKYIRKKYRLPLCSPYTHLDEHGDPIGFTPDATSSFKENCIFSAYRISLIQEFENGGLFSYSKDNEINIDSNSIKVFFVLKNDSFTPSLQAGIFKFIGYYEYTTVQGKNAKIPKVELIKQTGYFDSAFSYL